VLGIGADRPGVDKLLDSPAAGVFDQVQPHRHVGVEESARMSHVGPDPPHLGGQVNDHVGTGLLVEPGHVGLDGEVEVTPPGHRDPLRRDAAVGEHPADRPAEKARPAGDHDPLGREVGHGG